MVITPYDFSAKISLRSLNQPITDKCICITRAGVSKMGSLVLLVACWFLLKLTGSHAQMNCPTIESIFPPSGTVEVTFTITGNNLGGLQQIDVDIGTNQIATIGERNETHLQFLITGTLLMPGPRNVTFIATPPPACQAQLPDAIILDLRQGTYMLSVL